MPVHTQIAAVISSTHHRAGSTSSYQPPSTPPYASHLAAGTIGKASELEGLGAQGYSQNAYGATADAMRENTASKGKEPEPVYEPAVEDSAFTYDYEEDLSEDGEELVDGTSRKGGCDQH